LGTTASGSSTPANTLSFINFVNSKPVGGFAVNDRLWVAFGSGDLFEYASARTAAGNQTPTKKLNAPNASFAGIFYAP
jgi:hypothetical protein